MASFTYIRRLFVTDELMSKFRFYNPNACASSNNADNCNLCFECFALLRLKGIWYKEHKPSNPNGPNLYIVPMCHNCCNMIEASIRGDNLRFQYDIGGSAMIVNFNDPNDVYHYGRIEID